VQNESLNRCGLLWIDCLFINQANARERNHQVQRMDDISSGATRMFIWLGILPLITSAKKLVRPSRSDWCRDASLTHYRRCVSQRDIVNNVYWTRAWMTQEVLLARHVSVLLKETVLVIGDLLAVGYTPLCKPEDFSDTDNDFLSGFAERDVAHMFIQLITQRDKSRSLLSSKAFKLISVLYILLKKRCMFVRDRAFSLVALYDEGDRIWVD
jgi:hypothetical protein